MAKKFRGEITLDNGYVMVMDMNALIEFEELTGKDPIETISKMESGERKLKDLRAFYFACLKRHQPEITIEDCGDLIADYPTALTEVVTAASPDATEAAPAGKATTKKK